MGFIVEVNENGKVDFSKEQKVKIKNAQNNILVTDEMKKFAEEYALWVVSAGQKYISALSPDFTIDDKMEIFISKYYQKWLK